MCHFINSLMSHTSSIASYSSPNASHTQTPSIQPAYICIIGLLQRMVFLYQS